MSEEIEYAEMLEIPVSTVNVVRKKRRRWRDLKAQAVGKVNERMEQRKGEKDKTYAGNEFSGSSSEEQPNPPSDDGTPPADTDDGVIAYGARQGKTHPVIVAEFAAACLLCLTIFLTNLFMSDSAINTFLRGVFNVDSSAATVKTYSDFTLSGVVSEYAEVETTLSSTGVLSFTAACSVYPACEGTVSSVTRSGETYTVVLSHSATFESVYSGLSSVYGEEGAAVLPNVPFAYSDGENTVQVSFYQDGEMLNCYSVDAQNCLSWNQ